MEKIESDLKEFELKQRSLAKAYDSVHAQAQANSFVIFTVQWKDLEDHFDSTRNSLEARFRELEAREEDIGVRDTKSEPKDWNFRSEISKNNLHSLMSLIEEHSDEVLVQEKLLMEVEKYVREKEMEFYSIDKRVKERTKRLNWVEKIVEEKSKLAESKEGEVKGFQEALNKYVAYIELKKRQLNEILGSIEKHKKEFDLKQELIEATKRSIEECDKELILKEEKLRLIQKSLVECSNTLESKEKMIGEIDLKERDFGLLKKSMEERSCELQFKARELELIDKRVSERLNEVKLKEKNLDQLQKSIRDGEKHLDKMSKGLQMKECKLQDQAKELELKQKEFDSINKCSEEQTQNLKSKERQLEDQAKELELKQKEFDSTNKSTEEYSRNLKSKEKTNTLHSQVKIELLEHIPSNNAFVPSSASNQSSINGDGRGLQLLVNEQLKRIALVGSEISAVLEASLDQAKLVLDAMQGFYPSNSTLDNRECDLDLGVIRRSCILLLEALKKVSPQINPHVREEAIKLADDWKAKMTVTTDNRLEILGFLRLVTTYDITSSYDEKELLSFIAIVAEYEQATELSQALGSTENASAIIICSPEKPESSLAKNAAAVSSPNLQLTATTDARNLQGFLHELARGNHLIQNETLAALQTSLDPAKFVLDLMQNSFAQYWGDGDVPYKETVMLSYINLLEQLMGVSLHVGLHVKDDAEKLAIQWKAKMGADTQNSLERLGFLQFIATYGLLSTFTRDDIAPLLGRISQDKQTRELCQKLRFANKIPARFIMNLIERRQLLEAVRLICTFKFIDIFPPVPLLEKYVENRKNWRCRICKRKNSLDKKDKVLDNDIADLRAVIQCIKDCKLESEYPSGNIEIQIAMLEKIKEDRRRRSATSLACKVGQQEQKKCLPSNVEQQEHKNSPASKIEQQEQKKSLPFNFEQQEQKKSLLSNVEQQEQKNSPASKIEQQEQKKSLPSNVEQQEQKNPPASKVEQEEQKNQVEQQKRTWDQLHQQQQQQQQHPNKFQRTSGSAATPSRMPTSTPDYYHQHTSLPTSQHENYSHPGQIGMPIWQFGMGAANQYGIGANWGHPGQFGMYANNYANGAMLHSGIHQPYHFTPSPPTYGPYQPYS
ncbi:FRIGIDA-like protein 5 [Prunus yedoensis var. nudiflora]|uniref:FRIGIDA-like protein 5 n=1 Tax=Prunus yedoensis var. nudiflora TaxID=2094558 RepID=A0A314V097_PRUYE|nr:FRIGIDA-like protein 5 [Prunus yedoensis var. nudiflora]